MTTPSGAASKLLIQPGQPMPGFSLSHTDGKTVRLTSFKQRRPVLIAILHSTTCPNCREWLSGLVMVRDDFAALDVQPLLIFPDDPSTIGKLQATFHVPGTLLADFHGDAFAHYVGIRPMAMDRQVLLIAVNRYNVCLELWLADEPLHWPPFSELLALFAFAEQDDCACGLPVWPED